MKKYVIITGCSYAYKSESYLKLLLQNLFNKKNKLLDGFIDVKIINIGASSAGNEFICESSIIAVKKFLNDGVNPKDILVLNNYTQIFRPVVKLPYEYHIKVEPIFANSADKRSFENIKYISTPSLLKFQNQVYSFLISKEKLSHEVKDWYEYQSDTYRVKRIVEQYFEKYLESIVIMQSFLKKHNISNISFLMNNVFDGWTDKLSHVYTNNTKFSLPSTKDTKHISEISDYTNVLWDCIDLESFVFHQTEENKYGGIDEYMLDKFPDIKYLQDKVTKGFHFGNHPNDIIYKNFTDEYMVDKLSKWINEIHN
jgi:hypothetical protein